MTGWERYAKSLRTALGDRVHGFAGAFNRPIPRLVADVLYRPRVHRLGDIYHFPTYPPMSNSAGRKTVWTVHDLTWWRYPETSSRLGKAYYLRLARAAAQDCTIATVSDAIRAEVVDRLGVPEERVSVIYPGATSLAVEQKYTPERPYILTVGTIEPRKNLATLLNGYSVSGLSSDFDLLAVGRFGWGRSVPGLKVLSGLSDSELAAVYEGAAAFVSASLYEGFGFPLLEAAAKGIPIACSDIPVYREVLAASAAPAVFFDPLDVSSIASSLDLVVRQGHTERLSTGLLARSWDVVATEVLSLYERL
jgi:glycosyltransferase involved in cell wall biosynthesis